MTKLNSCLALLMLLSFFGCTTSGSNRSEFTPIVPKLEQSEITGYINEIDKEIKEDQVKGQEKSVVEEDLFSGKGSTTNVKSAAKNNLAKQASSFGIEVNEKVEEWIRYFAEEDHERFQRFLNRGEMYRKLVEKVLSDKGLPKELYYLAMIESGFSTHARSHASAVGIWQFIRATGERYGLRVDYYVDERIDPVRATEAAANYLSDLNTVFQSWYLAMAAYNSGEMRVLGAIMKNNSRDFWELVEKKALPKETMNYVPKVLAAAIIGNHPERFGFKIEKADTPFDNLELVRVPDRVRLADVSRKIGIAHKDLKALNPHLRQAIVPDSKSDYKIWVPKNLVKETEQNYQYFASKRIRRPVMVAEQAVTYQVRPGDSLLKISQRFGVSVNDIKSLNNMRSNRILAGTKLKIYSGTDNYQRYRVKSGDSLAGIAAKFGTSMAAIQSANRMKSSRILAGATLKIPSYSQVSHRVRHGESLSRIAKKYGVSVGQLKRLNKLSRNRIYAGQVLKVKGKM